MAERAWPDGPTWEEIAKLMLSDLATQTRGDRGRNGLKGQRLWVKVADATGYEGTHSVYLCRVCGYDPVTGEKIEGVMDDN